jgi:hypothetical protein
MSSVYNVQNTVKLVIPLLIVRAVTLILITIDQKILIQIVNAMKDSMICKQDCSVMSAIIHARHANIKVLKIFCTGSCPYGDLYE